MSIITYESVKDKADVFRATTSLDRTEFDKLKVPFERAYHKKYPGKAKGFGRPEVHLPSIEDKLLFILFYFKCYPIQELLGFLFGMSQERANELIHSLSEVLLQALKEGGYVPERLPESLKKKLLEDVNQTDYAIDGTEREIQRPADDEKQEFFYSGKTKMHSVKNLIITAIKDRLVKYLSLTCEGKKHDKKIVDDEKLIFPDNTFAFVDSAFQAAELGGAQIHIPTKKPKGGELSSHEKEMGAPERSFQSLSPGGR